jgi:hypothetical protein
MVVLFDRVGIGRGSGVARTSVFVSSFLGGNRPTSGSSSDDSEVSSLSFSSFRIRRSEWPFVFDIAWRDLPDTTTGLELEDVVVVVGLEAKRLRFLPGFASSTCCEVFREVWDSRTSSLFIRALICSTVFSNTCIAQLAVRPVSRPKPIACELARTHLQLELSLHPLPTSTEARYHPSQL